MVWRDAISRANQPGMFSDQKAIEKSPLGFGVIPTEGVRDKAKTQALPSRNFLSPLYGKTWAAKAKDQNCFAQLFRLGVPDEFWTNSVAIEPNPLTTGFQVKT